jgi:ribose transport system permease protein
MIDRQALLRAAAPVRRAGTTILVYLVMGALLLAAEVISPGFFGASHMNSVLRQAAFLGIVAIGQTLVIIAGGIDLSIAPLISLANVMSAQIMDGKDANLLAAVVVVLLIGVACGLINGLGIYYLRISPLVMTLGMGSVVQGIAYIYSKGAPKGATAPLIKAISTGKVLGVLSSPLLIWVALAVITILVLRYTTLGRYIYAVGSNQVCARYSGVNIRATTIIIYVISSVMAAFIGLLLIGYTGTSYLDTGNAYTMNSIAAVVIGGTSVAGGLGGYAGTVAGSVIMTIIIGLLAVVRIPVSGRQIAQGLIILLILLAYGREKKRR